MKADTLMVLWHSKEPVFSVDFHSSGRLASSGADNDIKIWKIGKRADGSVSLDFLSSLTRHTKAVNVVRFSPDGNFLATGSDDGYIYIWKLNTSVPVLPDSIDKEVWSVAYTLRGKAQDVYDLAWSPDSSQIIVGSTDNSASVWSVKGAQCKHHFEHHNHYVQGVAWDPLGIYLLTFSSDRTLRAYTRKLPKNKKSHKALPPPTPSSSASASTSSSSSDPLLPVPDPLSSPSSPVPAPAQNPPAATPSKKRVKEKWIVAQLVNKREFPGTQGLLEKEKEKEKEESGKGKEKEKEKDCLQHKLFLDESVNTFFRRLTWSPEGSLLFLPTGIHKASPASPPTNVCYAFSRNNLNRPLFYIPSGKPVIAVRCSPILYKLWNGKHPAQTKPLSTSPTPSTPSSAPSPTSSSTSPTPASSTPVSTDAPSAPTSTPPATIPDTPMSDSPTNTAPTPTPTPAAPLPISPPSPSSPPSFVKLDYRIVFAIATVDSVVVYDTQHLHPLAFMGDMHYANMTDVTWSADGSSLIMSSTDGYCSYATFAPGELGTPLEENEIPSCMKEAILQRQQKAEEEEEEPSHHASASHEPNGEPSASASASAVASAPAATSEDTADAGSLFFGKRKEIPPNTTQDPSLASAKPAEKKPRRLAPTFISALPNK